MPKLSTYNQQIALARILEFGVAKTKKTWWAGLAAEAGYRVLILDGDNGTKILRNLTPEAQERIFAVNLQDFPDRAVFADFLIVFTAKQRIAFDEKLRRPVPYQQQNNPDVIYIDAVNWGHETLVVVDSWTKFVESLTLKFAIEHNMDLEDAKKIDWEEFGWAGRLATLITNRLRMLPCHLSVIAHATQYEKKKSKQVGPKVVTTTEFSRRQIRSTSGPHAMTMPGGFDEVLDFVRMSAQLVNIDVSGGKDADGGSRTVAPGSYDWKDLPIWGFLDGVRAEPAQPFDFSQPIQHLQEPIVPQSQPHVISPKKTKAKFSFGK